MPSFPDIDALNVWLAEQCIAQWGQIQHGVLPGTIADVHAEEDASLMPLGRHFDGFVESTTGVSERCMVYYQRHRHRVAAVFAHRRATQGADPATLPHETQGQGRGD